MHARPPSLAVVSRFDGAYGVAGGVFVARGIVRVTIVQEYMYSGVAGG